MNIPDSRLEKALHYLATSDQSSAELKADVARTEYVAKLREAAAYKLSEGTVEERKAIAKLAATSQEAWEKHFLAIAAYEKVRAKRELESLVVDVYRTVSANRRQGQI